MYVALYRKYRPDSLNDVVGQEKIVKTLINEIKNNKLSHAYLFAGPRGTGKTSVAKILAKIVNCKNVENGEACNKCVNCTQFNNNQMTDVIEIDAASNNGVDEIRALKSKVNLVPTLGKYKIYIIDEVHMLTVGAFNALLKTLEEPPSHAIFILATTDPHKIPITILSRCQRFDFEKIKDTDIVSRLDYIVNNENIKIEKEALFEIAKLSDGGMRDSISMLDQLISYNNELITINDIHELNGTLSVDNLLEFISLLVNNDLNKVLDTIDELNSKGKNLYKISEELLVQLKNILIYKQTTNYFLENNITKIYEKISKEITNDNLYNMILDLNKTLNEMKMSTNPKLLLELYCLKNSMNKMDNLTVSEEKNVKKTIVNVKKTQNNSKVTKPDIKVENTTEKKQIKDDVYLQKLYNFRDIRINNSLSKLDKSIMKEIQKYDDIIRNYILNEKYNPIASLLLDGVRKASGNNIVVYVYKTETEAINFNEKILEIEEFLEIVTNKNIKVVATDLSSWEIIKNEFNSKSKKYSYIEEPNLKEIIESQNKPDNEQNINEFNNIFGNIIEYE
jgi:DNA polymerase-3 subunit gamma/tau